MIISFVHRGLRRFFEDDEARGINPNHRRRLRLLLDTLDAAGEIQALGDPSFRLHPLRGNRQGEWSIQVNGPWRLTFRFEDGDVHVLNYENYH